MGIFLSVDFFCWWMMICLKKCRQRYSLKDGVDECNLNNNCLKQCLNTLYHNLIRKKLTSQRWIVIFAGCRITIMAPKNKTNRQIFESIFNHCIIICANLYYTDRYIAVFTGCYCFQIWQFYVEYSPVLPTCILQFLPKQTFTADHFVHEPIGDFRSFPPNFGF